MKLLKKLSLLVLIPLIGGIVTLIIGNSTDNETLAYVGQMIASIGTPVTMFALVVIGLILIITGKIKINDLDQEQSEQYNAIREEKIQKIEEMKSSSKYETILDQEEDMINHIADNYKHSTNKDKILGWLFFGFLMTDFALILVFVSIQLMIGAIICFCIFTGTILTSFFVVIIKNKLSMRARSQKDSEQNALIGTVKACVFSSSISTGARRKSNEHSKKVIYRVVIESNGKRYTAYSECLHEENISVRFLSLGNNCAKILESANTNNSPDQSDNAEHRTY